MLPEIASLLTMVACAGLLAAWRLGAAYRAAREVHAKIDAKLAALEALVTRAMQESQRLEAALALARAAQQPDLLAQIESLADEPALAEPHFLARVAAQMPAVVADDPFAGNERQLAIARLADQGLAASDIARRLSLPIGEVELLLSLRSA